MSKPVSKGVIVQFTSDSEDEGNTSSSSARGSSKDPALSSDDEGRKGGKSGAVTKTKTKGADKVWVIPFLCTFFTICMLVSRRAAFVTLVS